MKHQNRNQSFLLCAALLTLVLLLCLGCSNQQTAQPAQTTPDTADGIDFVDDDGRQIHLDAPCQTIISMYSAHTENLFAIGAGAQVIGGHKTCIYPPEAAQLDVYDYNGDPEAVIAAEPDAVLIRPFISRKAPEYIEALEKAGITVISLYADNYEEFPAYIATLGKITGHETEAAERLAEFQAEIDDIQQKISQIPTEDRQTVFLETTETNIRTAAAGSMAATAIDLAGGINLAEGAKPSTEGSSIAEYGVEQILAHADDIDVYVSQRGAMNAGGNLISISERPGYDTLRAVQNNRVYLINEKFISSPSFRFTKGVRELARFLYPDVMDDVSTYQNDTLATKAIYADLLLKQQHLPVYVPSSSKYYQTEQKGHTFGFFQDVSWQDDCFDAVETAVYGGYIDWRKGDDGAEYFDPDAPVTREQLAKTIFLLGDYTVQDTHVPIADVAESQYARIVQILVDHGVFALEDGKFHPERAVTTNEVLQALQQL